MLLNLAKLWQEGKLYSVPEEPREAQGGYRAAPQCYPMCCHRVQALWSTQIDNACECFLHVMGLTWLPLQASIVDVLQSDLAKIESLVREAMRQLNSAATSSSVRPLDACEVMEAMNRHHLQELVPRLEEADSSFEQLCTHCLDCKVCADSFFEHLCTHCLACIVPTSTPAEWLSE